MDTCRHDYACQQVAPWLASQNGWRISVDPDWNIYGYEFDLAMGYSIYRSGCLWMVEMEKK